MEIRSILLGEFQFTHPGGVRRKLQDLIAYYYKFQFTHPGGVRHAKVTRANAREVVSIHAPGRGATFEVAKGLGKRLVSIHAPGRGATSLRSLRASFQPPFQFTHPGGVRQYGAKLRIMGRINKRNLRLEVLL